MMNRFIYLFLLLGCTVSALVGCTDDPNVEPMSPARGDGGPLLTIDFCDNSFDEINITTRATLDNIAESRVGNLFVFLFNSSGDRLYGRYFDFTNRVNSDADLQKSKVECWWVADNATENEPSGKVRILAPAITEGCSLYVLVNINADMVNISPDKLRFVHSLDDLKNLTATLNQTIIERNGFFPMSGRAEGIGIDGNNITIPDGNGNRDGKIMLTRLDAKITVKVRVAKGYKGINTKDISKGETGSDEPGGTGTTEGSGTGATEGTNTNTETVKTTHTIDEFVPLSWQVVNLPRTSFVLPRLNEDAKGEDGKKEMFNTRETKFETRKAVTFPYVQEIIKKKDDGKFDYDYEYETDENGNYRIDENGNKIPKKSTRDSIAKTDEHGFSFYMLENRHNPDNNKYLVNGTATGEKKPQIGDGNYHLRDKRNVDAAGAYDTSKGLWKYAPEEGTYLIIKGEVVMALDLDNEGKNQQLSADVVYYIHLGDFKSNVNYYDIERNTSYTYTVTIYGVDKIQIEVEEHREDESGATGHVYVAKEKIFTFDSHYGRAVVSFDAGHLTDLEHMTWYVRTPFGREGKPHIINGVEVPAGLDYRWVQFKRNAITLNEEGKEVYSHNHEKYDPSAVKDVLEFSKYIKEQKALFDEDMKDGKNDFKSDFRPEEDEDWKAKFPKDESCWTRHRIYLTIFVNEFYYDADPITGDVRQDLWKDFVNQPHRLMHILCDADKSQDEASLTTGSVVTIRQRSIQTIFNTEKPGLKTAWGCETIDETRDVLWYYTRKEEKYIQAPPDKDNPNGYPEGYMIWQKPAEMPDDLPTGWNGIGNDSQGNGLYNTAKIWGLTSGDKYTAKEWKKYVNYDELYALQDDDEIETLRYSCMTRNRDENGNGLIDAKEVKWYIAAISQLASLYVGDQGLSSEAVLYPYYKQAEKGKELDEKLGAYKWRAHVVSSTIYANEKNYPYYPEILWAEEGLSTGSYKDTYGKSAPLTVRCLRNLGMDPSTEEEAKIKLNDPNNMATKAIDMKKINESVYQFDMTNLNPLSIRYYTSQELEPNDENSVEARVYWKFETGPMSEETYTYRELYNTIREGKSPCPEGYRTPNVREGALISLRCENWQVTDSNNNVGRVSTYYSHGRKYLDETETIELGTGQDPGKNNNSMSWVFNTIKTYIDEGDDVKIRCVKDVRQ